MITHGHRSHLRHRKREKKEVEKKKKPCSYVLSPPVTLLVDGKIPEEGKKSEKKSGTGDWPELDTEKEQERPNSQPGLDREGKRKKRKKRKKGGGGKRRRVANRELDAHSFMRRK